MDRDRSIRRIRQHQRWRPCGQRRQDRQL